jgi:YHS domain-containing protein
MTLPAGLCPICHRPLSDERITLRYEARLYSFDSASCKRIFQENPDRYLDASGAVLPQPR